MAAFSDSADSGQNIRQSWGTETDIVHDVSMLDIGSDTVEPVLCQWHRLELKYFCKHHMEELCTTCRRMKHNNCDSILDIKQATKAIYSKDHSEKLMQSIRGLCKQFDDCKTVAEGLKDNLQAKKAVHLDNVQQTRKTINDFLDKLDANAVADINRNFTQIKQATEEKINVCDASISALKSSLSDVGETKSIRNQTGKFIELNRATQQIKQYNDVIKQLHSEVSGIDANAEPALALSGAFESLENVFTETSKLTKLYCQTIVMPVYTGVPETESRDHEQVSNDGRSVLQAQDNTNSSQTRRRKIAPQVRLSMNNLALLNNVLLEIDV